jgi:hypothetical protein
MWNSSYKSRGLSPGSTVYPGRLNILIFEFLMIVSCLAAFFLWYAWPLLKLTFYRNKQVLAISLTAENNLTTVDRLSYSLHRTSSSVDGSIRPINPWSDKIMFTLSPVYIIRLCHIKVDLMILER